MRYGRDLGLVPAAVWQDYQAKEERIGAATAFLKKNRVKAMAGERPSLFQYLKKPDIELKDVLKYGRLPVELSYEETRYIESEAKYEGYIRKQEREIVRAERVDSMKIPRDMDFRRVSGLTREAVEKLEKIRPMTLGEARKIPGMTPAAVQNVGLFVEILRKRQGLSHSVPRETEPDNE
jgi:tRNA uridine 5-carboxymethylaminomethyl modification enzyme